MKITLKWLLENGACEHSISIYESQNEARLNVWLNWLLNGHGCFKSITEKERLQWCNWLIVRCMNNKQRVQHAIHAAESVLDIYEEKYPDDDRPQKAIEAAKQYLKNHSQMAADTASRAADTASRAADAAADAAHAADTAADAASRAASRAADAAAYAAYAASRAAYAAADTASRAAYAAAHTAADAAAYAAGWNKKMHEILLHGCKLLGVNVGD